MRRKGMGWIASRAERHQRSPNTTMLPDWEYERLLAEDAYYCRVVKPYLEMLNAEIAREQEQARD